MQCLVFCVQYVLCSVQSAAAERVTAQSFCNQLGKNLRKWTNFKLDDKDEDCIDNDNDDEAVMMMGSSWRKAAMNLEMVDKRFLHFCTAQKIKTKKLCPNCERRTDKYVEFKANCTLRVERCLKVLRGATLQLVGTVDRSQSFTICSSQPRASKIEMQSPF